VNFGIEGMLLISSGCQKGTDELHGMRSVMRSYDSREGVRVAEEGSQRMSRALFHSVPTLYAAGGRIALRTAGSCLEIPRVATPAPAAA